jgi:hypothetical protein
VRAVLSDNTARIQHLQMGTFAALRSMRSMFCGIPLCWGTKVPYPSEKGRCPLLGFE